MTPGVVDSFSVRSVTDVGHIDRSWQVKGTSDITYSESKLLRQVPNAAAPDSRSSDEKFN